ncbi:MAG: hypothetical protein A3F24_00255 [Candidatus Colwellbacteria bacterium RIFCSPHIGHO2_12_FULL_44_17]|uniref:Uncharacterized protein n=2 Tax=Candidatus Colwelliibacteriota TaxID=1817904 RepID=A0A1G1Z6I6_9BACT|nr:MAG: hypothetical protein A3F24_00255 [Candidatus Colwellbacteria bacterium RIFCSPHIGHO2_12_FULL_44_17]OGY60124.1 MAG: hypothetical protein A3I31_00205 [Candidatus Colwellbacteria bacterium RIFCSPLOWO2_02_FULL_44_20b]
MTIEKPLFNGNLYIQHKDKATARMDEYEASVTFKPVILQHFMVWGISTDQDRLEVALPFFELQETSEETLRVTRSNFFGNRFYLDVEFLKLKNSSGVFVFDAGVMPGSTVTFFFRSIKDERKPDEFRSDRSSDFIEVEIPGSFRFQKFIDSLDHIRERLVPRVGFGAHP